MKKVWTPRATLPPIVVGGVLAIAAELAAGLLLYSGLGFLQALSVVLAIEMVAFGVGLWIASGISRRGYVESLRRQWLLLLFAFSAAAIYATGWEILGGLSADPRSQGVGLAILAALPLFAGGAVLGLMLREESGLRPPEGRSFPGPGPLAAFGAGAGFLAAGHFILRNVTPTLVLLGCVIAISAAALVHGRILARRARAMHRAALAAREEGARSEWPLDTPEPPRGESPEVEVEPGATQGEEGPGSAAALHGPRASTEGGRTRAERSSRDGEAEYFAPFHEDGDEDDTPR